VRGTSPAMVLYSVLLPVRSGCMVPMPLSSLGTVPVSVRSVCTVHVSIRSLGVLTPPVLT